MTLRLGDTAPNFTAKTTKGSIDFYDWKGDGWAILFSHPKDFTPVCTTELGAAAKLEPEFAKRNCKIMGLSVDPVDSHVEWLRDVKDVTGADVDFPLVGDSDRRVADQYDMIHPNADDTATVRSVFIIAPDNTIKLTLTYPASTGRNFAEILRVLDSVQLTANHQVATPVDWQPGEDVIIVPAVSDEDAAKRFPGYVTEKPYLRRTAMPV